MRLLSALLHIRFYFDWRHIFLCHGNEKKITAQHDVIQQVIINYGEFPFSNDDLLCTIR